RVWLEGETDAIYFETAARLLGFDNLMARVDFEWIGTKAKSGGQPYNTGKDALNKAFALLSSNPDIVSAQIVLLYDSDAKKDNFDGDRIFVRSLPHNSKNKIATAGIENLLPESVFTDDVYDTSEKTK